VVERAWLIIIRFGEYLLKQQWVGLTIIWVLLLAAGAEGIGRRVGEATPKKPAAVVKMTDQLTFEPARVTIKAGETVRWKSASLLVHTVTGDPALAAKPEDAALPPGAKPFNSGNIKPGGQFQHTFKVPGTYRYFCIPHEGAGMIGVVVVQPATT